MKNHGRRLVRAFLVELADEAVEVCLLLADIAAGRIRLEHVT